METNSERLGRELGLMVRRHPRFSKACMAFVLGISALAWATYPPETLRINDACMPISSLQTASASIYGDRFWRRQIQASIVERERLERELLAVAAIAALQGEGELKVNALLEEQYRLYPQLAPTRAERYASQLRTQADAIEAAELQANVNVLRAREIEWLTRCEGEMLRQLGNQTKRL